VNQDRHPAQPGRRQRWDAGEPARTASNVRLEAPHVSERLADTANDPSDVRQILGVPVASELPGGNADIRDALLGGQIGLRTAMRPDVQQLDVWYACSQLGGNGQNWRRRAARAAASKQDPHASSRSVRVYRSAARRLDSPRRRSIPYDWIARYRGGPRILSISAGAAA
jgi:hypothetical protein